jgi:hypothetical protein
MVVGVVHPLGALAVGGEVVIDDVEDDRDAAAVALLDEVLVLVPPAAAVLNREIMRRGVAPVLLAAELRHRQKFDRGDAQVLEVVEQSDRVLECPGPRLSEAQRTDVQLVGHQVLDAVRDRPCASDRVVLVGPELLRRSELLGPGAVRVLELFGHLVRIDDHRAAHPPVQGADQAEVRHPSRIVLAAADLAA